jgi:hypothetical protein
VIPPGAKGPQVHVVTAYKSPNLIRYIRDRFKRFVIASPFMKWSDGEKLRGVLQRLRKG